MFGHYLFPAGRHKAARGGHSQGGAQHQQQGWREVSPLSRPTAGQGGAAQSPDTLLMLCPRTACWTAPSTALCPEHSGTDPALQRQTGRCFSPGLPHCCCSMDITHRLSPGQRPLWGALEGLHCCALTERGASSAAEKAMKAETTALFLSVNLQPGKDRGLLSAVFP